ncbi:MAG: GNAT family N-acetyltransferase [Bacteroidales bacterium]|nr:GNAT family N-acetyltransferase [Bacteroidales bacterium]
MRGKTINLRAIEPADIDILYKWENDTSIWYLSNTIEPFSKFILEQYILSSNQDIYSKKQLRLMIDINESKKTIGSIDLFDFDPKNKRAGIGILINKNERGKGYASEALELLINYSFHTLDLHQLYCNISADNNVSLKLFHNFGFKIIGLKKQWNFINDKWMDEYMLQLIK